MIVLQVWIYFKLMIGSLTINFYYIWSLFNLVMKVLLAPVLHLWVDWVICSFKIFHILGGRFIRNDLFHEELDVAFLILRYLFLNSVFFALCFILWQDFCNVNDLLLRRLMLQGMCLKLMCLITQITGVESTVNEVVAFRMRYVNVL